MAKYEIWLTLTPAEFDKDSEFLSEAVWEWVAGNLDPAKKASVTIQSVVKYGFIDPHDEFYEAQELDYPIKLFNLEIVFSYRSDEEYYPGEGEFWDFLVLISGPHGKSTLSGTDTRGDDSFLSVITDFVVSYYQEEVDVDFYEGLSQIQD